MNDLEGQRWRRLLRWLSEEHGMDVGQDAFHVEAREVEGAGRGLFTSRDCPRSTTLFKVPSTALLNRGTVLKLYPQLRNRGLSGVQLVSLHLLLHKPIGDADSSDGNFGPYISTLPRDFSSHPLSWMVKCEMKQADEWESRTLECLPPSASRRLSDLYERFSVDLKAILRALVGDPTLVTYSTRAGLQSMHLSPENHYLVMDYLWAWLNVNTRCIFYRLHPTLSNPDNFTLCPILDFANHSHGQTQIFPVVDSEAWSGTSKKVPKHFVFFGPSQDAVVQGQELYLQYGGHSNSFLISEYGFVNNVVEGAVASGVYCGEVNVDDLVEELFSENRSLGSRLRLSLEDEGYWGDWTLHSGPRPAHPSYRLVTALRLLHAFEEPSVPDETELERTLETWRNVVNGLSDHISPQNETVWRRSLLRICDQIEDRARQNLAIISAPDYEDNVCDWHGWMMKNVRMLWTEEYEVAKAVAASVLADVDF